MEVTTWYEALGLNGLREQLSDHAAQALKRTVLGKKSDHSPSNSIVLPKFSNLLYPFPTVLISF